MFWLYLISSFFIVSFGQSAWGMKLGVLAASIGFALFWRSCLFFPKTKDRFLLSMGWFTAVQGVQLSWMTTMDYMGPLILLVYLMLIVGVGAQFGLLSLLLPREKPVSLLRCVEIAGCWTFFEWIRIFFLTGYTWNPIGLSLADSPYAIQLAAVGGVYGLSFWVAFVNLIAFNTFFFKKRISFFIGVALFPYLFGLVHQFWVERNYPSTRSLSVALIQTAMLPNQRDFFSDSAHTYIHPLDQWDRLLNLVKLDREVDLIVFPEGTCSDAAFHALYDADDVQKLWEKHFGAGSGKVFPSLNRPFARLRNGNWKVSNAYIAQALSNFYKADLIMGLGDRDLGKTYNAAFHFSPNGLLPDRYQKRVLVPVGEYLPLTQWKVLSEFIAKQFGILDSFNPGDEAKIFKGPVPMGISICIEETFTDLIRQLRVKGAELFVNVTNDVWFPGSKLPLQHFEHGRLRAVENGVYMLRACNTGITGGVDCFGKPLGRLPASDSKAGTLFLTVPVRSYPTLYTFWGDWAVLGIGILSILSVALNRTLRYLLP